MKKILLMFVLLYPSLSLALDFKVDKVHSNVGFKVKHLLITTVRGNFLDYSGVISYDEKLDKITKIEGNVVVDSITTNNVKRDGHLKSDDFFYEEKYPTMYFKSNKIKGDKAYGDLTIRGNTKKVVFDLEIGGIAKNRGKKLLGASLRTTINRYDYGLKWNKLMEAGGLSVGKKVDIILDLQAVSK